MNKQGGKWTWTVDMNKKFEGHEDMKSKPTVPVGIPAILTVTATATRVGGS